MNIIPALSTKDADVGKIRLSIIALRKEYDTLEANRKVRAEKDMALLQAKMLEIEALEAEEKIIAEGA